MDLLQSIPPDVAGKLGYYVYAYVNPLDDAIFYVGKGKGRRVLRHLRLEDQVDSRKVTAIREIRAAGRQPRLDILAHGLPSAETALQLEAAVIDALGLSLLTNQVRGWRSSRYGRTPLSELVAFYRRRPVKVRGPAILIRINNLYRPQMSAAELYDATRASWRVGERRTLAKYAFAVFEGIVREVYEITEWLPQGATFNSRDPDGLKVSGNRWEFIGRLAPQGVRRRYLSRDVSGHFTRGAQNPIAYVGVPGPRCGRRKK